MHTLQKLNKSLLKEKLLDTDIAPFSEDILNYEERVLQIGEGNFLRAFVNWMMQEMNRQGEFQGRSVVIQPIRRGRVDELNEQDCLYTLILRGIKEGEEIDKREIITSISRGLKSYQEWEEILELAENPDIDIVVSNTTEAGIAYDPEDRLADSPPDSFPGKLTAYLYHRYEYFAGDPKMGMLVIPVELIDRNGDNLKRIILKLADDWDLPDEFKNWIKSANHFLNTLVDRIVPGYPRDEAEKLEKELGYKDKNMTTGEIFHLWIIEGDKELKDRFPLHKAGLNVRWVDDLTPYRTRKVRILNGAHTSTVPVACLAGIEIVREAMNDKIIGEFIKTSMFEEIIPTLDFSRQELEDFAYKIIERFKNPFIDHRWLDISLNSISKFKTRVLPSILEYQKVKGKPPTNLIFSLAALIMFYQGEKLEDGKLVVNSKDKSYFIKDETKVLKFFLKTWNRFRDNRLNLSQLAETVLSREDFWDRDLNQIPALREQVVKNLKLIKENDMITAVEKILSDKG